MSRRLSLKYYRQATNFFSGWGISFNYLGLSLLLLLGTLFLTYNIYNTVRRAEANYEIKRKEQEQRDILLEESKELDKKIQYLESVDAKNNLAAEGYKLAQPGETLYKIDREEDVVQYIEDENPDPIKLEDNSFWWKVILLGIDQ